MGLGTLDHTSLKVYLYSPILLVTYSSLTV